ncbi:class I SAM-dependent methyltransferase [Rasiella rasia]|uniref:Class I SAM-dependent methyltransferase n=1 Tax=Rasiella rasia TaxID=2744027 RepID=A0A6G6GHL3_9FLAO|nr:class I SAM-dependent methyltransferase [Rasiella rasia]QIE58007.1 class I SAM-dependent methyltransferase [Rasiella rasia]
MTSCILCNNETIESYYKDNRHDFLKCTSCTSVFRNPLHYLDAAAEKERYLSHNNDINDTGYQHFVFPIIDAVARTFSSDKIGLDYGAGTGPVITKLLAEKGYTMKLYDPFFHPNTGVLQETYDFIVCCEVMEHFHHPLKEFRRLQRLLKPNGKLFCMTNTWETTKTISDFKKWYYKNDPTHVIFYNGENLERIKNEVGFSEIVIDDRLITIS